mgnify:CR=1 FL=1
MTEHEKNRTYTQLNTYLFKLFATTYSGNGERQQAVANGSVVRRVKQATHSERR